MDNLNDPNWHHESIIYKILKKRISVIEFLSLFFCDKDWTHLSTRNQTEKIFDLFNKVYGYSKDLSKIEE
jgi:hypothetical protein